MIITKFPFYNIQKKFKKKIFLYENNLIEFIIKFYEQGYYIIFILNSFYNYIFMIYIIYVI